MWSFRSPCHVKARGHSGHLKRRSFSCTAIWWCRRLHFWLNARLQWSHLYGRLVGSTSSACIACRCCVRYPWCVKERSQCGQRCGRLLSCTDAMCFFKLVSSVKILPHFWHGSSGRGRSCTAVMWRFRSPVRRNVRPHTWHCIWPAPSSTVPIDSSVGDASIAPPGPTCAVSPGGPDTVTRRGPPAAPFPAPPTVMPPDTDCDLSTICAVGATGGTGGGLTATPRSPER
mmetsp:Transcript_22039/g.70942  ORF Transcript_22039/g.70942 Transcript_22039/m.70942 type:complete len:229 (-) Transcript_22039:263-949(-)